APGARSGRPGERPTRPPCLPGVRRGARPRLEPQCASCPLPIRSVAGHAPALLLLAVDLGQVAIRLAVLPVARTATAWRGRLGPQAGGRPGAVGAHRVP